MNSPEIPQALVDRIAQQCASDVPDSCALITGALKESYGDALQGILFYGSCSRGESMEDGIADVFVVVDSYRNAYTRRYLAWLNACLPPNVLYREIPTGGAPVRLKLALISMADFSGGIRHGFHSYLWGRFAQPARILHARTGAVRREFHELMAQSVLTLLGTTLPTLQGKISDAETVWTNALSLSYSTEFRSEPDSKAGQLVRHNQAAYTALLDASLPALESILRREGENGYRCLAGAEAARRTHRQWRRRRRLGHFLWVLRLIKAALTFSNGVDYAAWKIGRHAGVEIEVTPRLRRYPLLFGWGVFLKLVKRGILR
ncbi:MAG: hypothetical protein OXN26_06840 [Gammaproteobacteria bacterium]|nr:hypothetical protein [Gammaproteobacteria bacterium]